MGKKSKKSEKKESESQFDKMMANMDNISDEEDFEQTITETKTNNRVTKVAANFMEETIETVKIFKKNVEYESETYTSTAGGKLIINSIKKKKYKGKASKNSKA